MDNFENGRYNPDTVEAVLDSMMIDAEAAFGEELPDDTVSVLRAFYRPHAIRLVELQRDLALILDSAQIDHATEQQLDLLTALIGVPRKDAKFARGEVVFSRETTATVDYTIPTGTTVSTRGDDPVVFSTAEPATLASGTTTVTVPVSAEVGGSRSNVAPDTITVIRDPVGGVEAVTNPTSTSEGEDRERDDELRLRAKDKLTPGAKASAQALITQTLANDAVRSASIFINDTNTANGDGQPPHSFELVVDGPGTQDEYDTLAQMVLDTKAAGDTSSSGVYGSSISGEARLINGQVFTVPLSKAVSVKINIDMGISVTGDYVGDDAVRDSIVRYIGGVLSSNGTADGQLDVGGDVIYGSVEYAIRTIGGVYDIDYLNIAADAAPTGTDYTNITIALNEKATADATDGSIGIATTPVSL